MKFFRLGKLCHLIIVDLRFEYRILLACLIDEIELDAIFHQNNVNMLFLAWESLLLKYLNRCFKS